MEEELQNCRWHLYRVHFPYFVRILYPLLTKPTLSSSILYFPLISKLLEQGLKIDAEDMFYFSLTTSGA